MEMTEYLSELIHSDPQIAAGAAGARQLAEYIALKDGDQLARLAEQRNGWTAAACSLSDWGDEAYNDVAETYTALMKANGIFVEALVALKNLGLWSPSSTPPDACHIIGLSLGLLAYTDDQGTIKLN